MTEWKLVPVDPTDEMLECGAFRILDAQEDIYEDQAQQAYRAMVQAAPASPNETITLEEARDGMRWQGMDGACAWHLIDRHANGWAEVGMMMQAWLEVNRLASPAPDFALKK